MGAEVTISSFIPEELSQGLDRLASLMGRDRSWVVEEAIRWYIDEQAWQVRATRAALDDYRSGNAELVSHETVESELDQLEAQIKAVLAQ
jgi:predicted transcriptional regulator